MARGQPRGCEPCGGERGQEAGPTGFAAVSRDTDHFGDKQQFMVKFRTKTHPRALASFR